MDAQQAKALREEFPASAVGKLPRLTCRACSDSQRKRCERHEWVSHCPECRGSHSSAAIHLDYVGHAATTDRLLQVDPEWTWEPLALDEQGLPALDRAGNMWIRLTVAGVTRIGVGDGKSAKEVIGDAISNAAMRFGVALDLWAKEDLHAAETEGSDAPQQTRRQQPRKQAAKKTSSGETGEAITQAQSRAMHATFNDVGISERDARLTFVRDVIGRDVDSSSDLTRAEASKVLDELKKRQEQPFPTEEPPEEEP